MKAYLFTGPNRTLRLFLIVCLAAYAGSKLLGGPELLTFGLLSIWLLGSFYWLTRGVGTSEDRKLSWRWPFIGPIQKESSPDSSSGPQDVLNSKT